MRCEGYGCWWWQGRGGRGGGFVGWRSDVDEHCYLSPPLPSQRKKNQPHPNPTLSSDQESFPQQTTPFHISHFPSPLLLAGCPNPHTPLEHQPYSTLPLLKPLLSLGPNTPPSSSQKSASSITLPFRPIAQHHRQSFFPPFF